ncbi:MAG: PorT family protein [Paludibacteraceae bacterium]|nr:PorT family protein [Paludibacteraceae bacterium]
MLAFVLMALQVSARFRIGLEAGYTSSLTPHHLGQRLRNITWSEERRAMQDCYTFGLTMRIGGRVYAQTGLFFAHRDADYEVDATTPEAASASVRNIKAATLDVPVMLGYSIINNRLFRLRVDLGPKFSLKVSDRQEYRDYGGNVLNMVADNLRAGAIGGQVGVGVDLLNRITVDCRYNLMTDLRRSTAWHEQIRSNYADPHNGIVLSVGLLLN